MKVRNQPNIDKVYDVNNKVIFLDKNNDWDGPGNVVGTDANIVFVHHNGNYKRISKCNVRRWSDSNPAKNDDKTPNINTEEDDAETHGLVETDKDKIKDLHIFLDGQCS